jgi:3'-5' exoribonuclease-like protein
MNMHVMLDLETLSTRKNAAIIQIAAVVFDSETGAPRGSFNVFVRDFPAYCHVDPGTVAWWLQQKAAATIGAGMSAGGSLQDALEKFCAWFAALGPVEAIWSHGATFDIPVLCSALAACNVAQPWSYRAERDTRTLYALAPGGMPSIGRDPARTHDALYDCEMQIQEVVGALRALRGELAAA